MKPYTTRFITGLSIVLVGGALLLSNLRLVNFDSFLHQWWPLLLIVAGLLMLLNSLRNYWWPLIIIIAGIMFQLRELSVVDVNPWQLLWPSVLIFAGLSIIFNRSGSGPQVSNADRDDVMALLSGSDQRSTSDNYLGSKLTAVMGGVKLDLRKATIKEQASIEIFAFWGGVEVIVPRNVIIKNQMSMILGGVEDKTDQDKLDKAPVLYLSGDVIMAGVEIKN